MSIKIGMVYLEFTNIKIESLRKWRETEKKIRKIYSISKFHNYPSLVVNHVNKMLWVIFSSMIYFILSINLTL